MATSIILSQKWSDDEYEIVDQFGKLYNWVTSAYLSNSDKKLALKLLRSQFNKALKAI